MSKTILNNAINIWNQEWKWNTAIILVKYFYPLNNWTWYITEIEKDWMAFGLTYWLEKEWGYINLFELEQMKVNGLVIERDLYFTNKVVKDIESA